MSYRYGRSKTGTHWGLSASTAYTPNCHLQWNKWRDGKLTNRAKGCTSHNYEVPVPASQHSPSEPKAYLRMLPISLLIITIITKNPLPEKNKYKRRGQGWAPIFSLRLNTQSPTSQIYSVIIQSTNAWEPAACRAVCWMCRDHRPALTELTVYIQDQLA